jgi:hypothetical protein
MHKHRKRAVFSEETFNVFCVMPLSILRELKQIETDFSLSRADALRAVVKRGCEAMLEDGIKEYAKTILSAKVVENEAVSAVMYSSE